MNTRARHSGIERRLRMVALVGGCLLAAGCGSAGSGTAATATGGTTAAGGAVTTAVRIRANLGQLRRVAATPARSRYVAPSGSDRNPGTRARPWRTIGRALASARPGQTIFLRRGTYPERASAERGGTAAAPLTIRPYPREQPVLTGTLTLHANWIRVSGLRFVGGTAANRDEVLLYVSGADHIEVSGNNMRGSVSSAIFLGDGDNLATDVRVIGNRIHDNGNDNDFDHGVYCGHARAAVIANNIIDHNRAYGVQAYPDCDDALIVNNTIVANGRGGIVVGGSSKTASERTRVANNIIARSGDAGVLGFWEGSTGRGNTVIRNLFFRNSGGSVSGPGLSTSGNTSRNPLFRSEAARRYSLRAGSPAIGRAIVALAPARDITGRARGPRRDLGAIEARPGR